MQAPPARSSSATRPFIRVVIADESEILRRGLRDVFATTHDPTVVVVAETGTPSSTLAACVQHKPDVLLLEIRLRNGSGLSICRDLLRDSPNTRILVLASESTDALVYQAMTSGVSGYLTKDIEARLLVEAISDTAAGRAVFGSAASESLMRTLPKTGSSAPAQGILGLSYQQREVLRLVAAGLTNKEVGAHLQLSENTVRNYLVRVFDKLGVKRRAQAAAMMVQHTHQVEELAGN